MMKSILKISYTLLLLCLSVAVWAENYPSPLKPFRYVNDYTQTLTTQEWQVLENKLKEYHQATSSQIAVVIIPSTQGEEIAHYSHTLFDKWGIGQKKENNGVLLLVAKQDRKLFIATGRGLEGALPDAVAASIIRHDITPFFKQGEYAQGIAKGLSAIIRATEGEYQALPAKTENEFDGLWFFLIAGLVIFLIFKPRGSERYISPRQVEDLGKIIYHQARHRHSEDSFSNDKFGGGSTGGGGAGGSW